MDREEKTPAQPTGFVAANSTSASLKPKPSSYKVIDPGHHYEVTMKEWGDPVELIFVKKRPAEPGEKVDRQYALILVHDGLTNESVLEVLISRMHYLESMNPCETNRRVIEALNLALQLLHIRTSDRNMRKVEGTSLR